MEAHGVRGLDDEDELGVGRELALDLDDAVEVGLVAADGRLAEVAAVLLGAAGLLVPHGTVGGADDVAGNGLAADVVAVGGVGAVLQRGRRARDGAVFVYGHGGLARGAVDDENGVLALRELLVGGHHGIGGLVDRVARGVVGRRHAGEAAARLAGRLAHGVGQDVEVLVCHVLVDGETEAGRRRGEHASAREQLRDIDAGLVAKAILGDDVAGVLQHDDGLLGRLDAKLGIGFVLEDGLGLLAIGVGLVEEVDVVHAGKDAAGRVTHAGQGLVGANLGLELLVCLGEVLDVELAAKLVVTGLEALELALGGREVLDAPNAVLHKGAGLGVTGDLPVGRDHAVPAGVTQVPRAQLGEAAAHVLSVLLVLIVGDAVVGHDGGALLGLGAQVEGAVQERDEVGAEVVAGEDIVLAAVGVVIAAALHGTGATVVLGHAKNRLAAPALVVGASLVAERGLHAGNERLREVAVKRRVLRSGAAVAAIRGVR